MIDDDRNDGKHGHVDSGCHFRRTCGDNLLMKRESLGQSAIVARRVTGNAGRTTMANDRDGHGCRLETGKIEKAQHACGQQEMKKGAGVHGGRGLA